MGKKMFIAAIILDSFGACFFGIASFHVPIAILITISFLLGVTINVAILIFTYNLKPRFHHIAHHPKITYHYSHRYFDELGMYDHERQRKDMMHCTAER